ncbi:MAG TPA: hypothetical protein VGG85_15505 [Terracidiphilus sp.]|jgi:hypothetical protein
MLRLEKLLSLTPVLFALALSPAYGRTSADPLAATRSQLETLATCLGSSNALTLLRKGLLWGWRQPGSAPSLRDPQPAPPPPPEYSESLERDVQACAVASHSADEDLRRQILSAVEKDIEIKAEDCRKFGMGRKVPVNITTLRGSMTEHGWQVFYKWSCASALQPEEVRVPNLTSPAKVELPPGVYSVRAEKRISPLKVQTVAPVTVVVGSAATVPLELAIE